MAIIGVSANLQNAEKRVFYQDMALYYAEENIIKLIEKSGHTPVILPIHQDHDKGAENLINIVDALVLSGGSDISPTLYNEEPKDIRWSGVLERDHFELALLKHAKKRNIPVLGICRGFQLINIAYGGSLIQDIPSMRENSFEHRNQEKYEKLTHGLTILKDSFLYDVIGEEKITVNSVHHQGIKELGKNLDVMAYSDDGLIEAVKANDADFVVAVQWHPEWQSDEMISKKIYYAFLDKIGN